MAAGALCGLWLAASGPHGPEVVETRVLDRGEGLTLAATKLTGNPHVPAGEMTWEVRLPPRRQESRFTRRQPRPSRFAPVPREGEEAELFLLGTALPALVQVAEAGFVEPRRASATLEARRATATAQLPQRSTLDPHRRPPLMTETPFALASPSFGPPSAISICTQ